MYKSVYISHFEPISALLLTYFCRFVSATCKKEETFGFFSFYYYFCIQKKNM